jgi:hypothetical protein
MTLEVKLKGTNEEMEKFFDSGSTVRLFEKTNHIKDNVFEFDTTLRVSDDFFKQPKEKSIKAYMKAVEKANIDYEKSVELKSKTQETDSSSKKPFKLKTSKSKDKSLDRQ